MMQLADCKPGVRVKYVGDFYHMLVNGTVVAVNDAVRHPVVVLADFGNEYICSPAELEPMEAANGKS